MEYIRKYDCSIDKMGQHYNCIYYYKNKTNNKGYVGQTVNFLNRFRGHKKPSSNRSLLDRAIAKHGLGNFEVYILEESVKDFETLNLLERKYIVELNTLVKDGGYNIREGGNNSPLSENTKKKLSETRKGRTMTEETREKIRSSMMGEDNHFYGKNHSKETKQKISDAKKGKTSPRKGVTLTEDTKQKLSNSRKGKYTNGDNPSARAVYCITTNTKFETIKEASIWCNVGRTAIIQCCRKNHEEQKYTSGVHPITGERLKWMYYDEYILTDRKET